MKSVAICLAVSISTFVLQAQTPLRPDAAAVIVRPARVFDGVALREGWAEDREIYSNMGLEYPEE